MKGGSRRASPQGGGDNPQLPFRVVAVGRGAGSGRTRECNRKQRWLAEVKRKEEGRPPYVERDKEERKEPPPEIERVE